jgi:hypothetical protein
MVKPQNISALEGKDAERFAAQDKRPLGSAQKAHLAKCLEIYKKNPIKK